MNKKLIRKMLTAAGGPLRIKFTPEEIALFESQATRVPGMNNSGGNRYREEGVLALLYLEQEAKRKEEEIKSRMEMRPTLKRRATFSEKLRGKKDEYVPTTQIVGMSGADPLLSFYVEGVGLNGIGALAKTGLWNVAKYAPRTQLGNYGRLYFVGNTFKNSSLGEPFMSRARVPIEEGYMYHTYENPYPGFVENGVHWNMERRPGSVGIKDGKYYSNRFKTDSLNDRIWWDTNGHNVGDNVLVTKEGGFKINDPESLAKPYGGVYYNSYRTTPRIESNKVIQFKYDPIVGYTITRNPFRQISTNKMSIRELFTPKSTKPIQKPSISLKFFERPTLSNGQELAGATRWERNFRPQWHVANYPGYLLKGLMRGSLLEKQLSKNGTININLLNAYFNKASQLEREVANKVLAEKFAGLKTIDYNLFKKAVLDELITYNVKPEMQYSTYGMDRLGFNVIRESNGNGGIVEYLPGIRTNTFTFESPRIPVGNNKHYNSTTLGHSRTYTIPDEPNILHVMESLSDWGQHPMVIRNFPEKYFPTSEEVNLHNIRIIDRLEKQVDPKHIEEFLKLKYYALKVGADNLGTVSDKFSPEFIEYIDKKFPDSPFSNWLSQKRLASLRFNKAERANLKQWSYLHDNYLQRQLQENLRYAAENGQTKMRYPTSETAAKIEGYAKQNLYKNSEGKIVTSREALQHSDPNIINDLREDLAELASNLRRQGILPSTNQLWIKMNTQLKELESPKLKEGFLDIGLDYPLEHQTILKKYADFPKLFLKLYKGQNVRTVTDTKGNTWYEVDVPKGYLSREWQFKQGGKMNKKLIKMLLGGLFKLTDYIKAIENPDSIGWNGRVWTAPTLKGYDKNQRGFGIDVNTNKEARALTEGRPGRWLTDREANTLMNNHINYITKAANKHIKGFSKLPPKRQAALLGMLYRGDSVNKSGINIYEPNDRKFFKSISNYYRSKGLNTRADNSDKFFNIPNKLKMGGLLEFLKNGSGIHIKKKNRGKFTEYCGGKVTQECIRKAKASGNPTLIKRATFADNARHFKHRLGGSIVGKHLLGGNLTFSNPNAFGGVFENVILGRLRDWELQLYRKKLKEQQALIDLLLEQLKSDVISNILGTAVNTGLNYLLKSKQEKAT